VPVSIAKRITPQLHMSAGSPRYTLHTHTYIYNTIQTTNSNQYIHITPAVYTIDTRRRSTQTKTTTKQRLISISLSQFSLSNSFSLFPHTHTHTHTQHTHTHTHTHTNTLLLQLQGQHNEESHTVFALTYHDVVAERTSQNQRS